MSCGATGVQKCEFANGSQVTARYPSFSESSNVNPVFDHLSRDEFHMAIQTKPVAYEDGSQTKQLMSRSCSSRCTLCLVGSIGQLITFVLVPQRYDACTHPLDPCRYLVDPGEVQAGILSSRHHGRILPQECSVFLGQGRRESLRHPFVSPCPHSDQLSL